MRAGLSTIQQTLTPEAASVLNHSIAEAGRRNHGQTTPLHVAATLLSTPSGFLRQACIKSHPNSSHPLQCRALELCFSVALERLPTAQNTNPSLEPPISNALMAALKRAQAHQRRGCPEQQQQPLLAVKVELEQLIISILDDPSVSRVMREASFSSPAVKATIERSLSSSGSAAANSGPIGLGFRPAAAVSPAPTRNLYLNPRLQQGGAAQWGNLRGEEVKRVIDILMRTKKRNPVLVGESKPELVVKEVLRRIENRELGDGVLKNLEVIHLEKEFLDKDQIASKVTEFGGLIESRMGDFNGIVLNLGDLKWLVEQPIGFGVSGASAERQVVSEGRRAAVAEMGKILARFRENSVHRVWLIGTATCETYLRCQVYHPTMENEWDLQAVPVAARAPLPGMFPRLGATGILSSSVELLFPMKNFPTATIAPISHASEKLDCAKKTSCCPQCMQNYEQELAKLVPKELEQSSPEAKLEANQSQLPQWLQNAKAHESDAKTVDQTQTMDKELILKQKTEELQKKWFGTCLNLHPNFHHPNNIGYERTGPMNLSMTGVYNTSLLGQQAFQSKLQVNKNLGETLQLKLNPLSLPHEQALSPRSSPVTTDLVLGQTKQTENSTEQTRKERIKDFLSCICSESNKNLQGVQSNKLHSTYEVDSFKNLLKGLMEKVWWQQEAASAVATTVTQCKLGNGKRRFSKLKGDMWILFMGPDRVGKKKMASALAELVSGSNPVMICLGSKRNDGDLDVNFRGKTALDRISEAVRRNPFSVIVLNDIDEADNLFCESIKQAMERGRLTDTYGREISLGNAIFVLTANWIPDSLKVLSNSAPSDEEKLSNIARHDWQLKLSLCERTSKRRPNWLNVEEDRSTKPRKETSPALAFDLNEAADIEDDKADGSHNSSDLTVDHEDEHGPNNRHLTTTSVVSRELLDYVDNAIIFKPVDFNPVKRNITNSITEKFSTIIGDGVSIEVPEEAVEKILSGVWLGKTGVEEWIENVLVPSFQKLKACLPSNTDAICSETQVVRLDLDSDSSSPRWGELLPGCIKVVVGEGM